MRSKPTVLPPDDELDRLACIVRQSGAAVRLEHALRAPGTKGRRRQASAELYLTIAIALLSEKNAVKSRDVEALIAGDEVARLQGRLDALPGVRPHASRAAGRRAPITIDQWRRFWGDVAHLPYADVFAAANLLLLAWLPVPPPLGRRVLFDATIFKTHASPLDQGLRAELEREGSVDFLLRRERKLREKRRKKLQHRRAHRAHEAAYGHATKTRQQPKRMVGGYALHPVITTSGVAVGHELTAPPAPTVIVAIDVTPASGFSSPTQLKTLLDLVRRTYDLPNDAVVVADRDYSKSFEIWAWLRAQQRPFAFDLREEQLEPRGEHLGALLAQGNCLCPATPRHLRNPGKRPMSTAGDDHHPNPEYQRWLDHLRAQTAYRCHLRSVRPHGINVSCPALGPSPKVDCTLRGKLDSQSRRPVVLEPPKKTVAPPICRQKTVFIPDTANPLRQTHRWGTPNWLKLYQQARARNEGVHGELKHPQGYGLAGEITGSSRRNVVALHVALVMALLNYDKVLQFVDAHPRDTFSQGIVVHPVFGSSEPSSAT